MNTITCCKPKVKPLFHNGHQGDEEKPNHLVEGGNYVDKDAFKRATMFNMPHEITGGEAMVGVQFLVSEMPLPRYPENHPFQEKVLA